MPTTVTATVTTTVTAIVMAARIVTALVMPATVAAITVAVLVARPVMLVMAVAMPVVTVVAVLGDRAERDESRQRRNNGGVVMGAGRSAGKPHCEQARNCRDTHFFDTVVDHFSLRVLYRGANLARRD